MADKEKKMKNSPEAETKPAKKASAKAEKSTKKADKKGNNGKDKKPNIFVRMGKGIRSFCKNFKADVKKIVWPDLKTVAKNTGVVLVCVLAAGLVIFGIDFVLTEILDGVKNLASDAAITPLFFLR